MDRLQLCHDPIFAFSTIFRKGSKKEQLKFIVLGFPTFSTFLLMRTLTLSLFLAHILLSCQTTNSKQSQSDTSAHSVIRKTAISDSSLYDSENLVVNKLSDHVFQHISYLQTNDFGKVACNGMIVVNGKEAVVFDTPGTNESAQELIDYLTGKLRVKIKGVIATHFHADCVGGLEAFHKKNVPSYAENRTIAFLQDKDSRQPQNGFDKSLALAVGDHKVYAQFIGEGHTKDNVIGYFPADKAMFGGCLVKEVGGAKGNLEDANVAAWPETARAVKAKYPETVLVIPGHGRVGGQELLDYTAKLFDN